MIKKILQAWRQAINPYQRDKLTPRYNLEPITIVESDLKKISFRYFLWAFVLFFIWASYAPLDAGVHLNGTIIVQGNRKAVQHPHGGVVDEILIYEGSQVKQGDVLIRINQLSTQADLNSKELDYINALCEESRLIAERERLNKIHWLDELIAFGSTTKVEEAKMMQVRLINSRRQDFNNKVSILQEQIAGLEQLITELQGIIKIRKHQLELITEDAKNNADLAKEGYVSQSHANELERARSDLLANIASTIADISKHRSNITSAKLQIAQETSAFFKDVDAALKDVQQKRKSLQTAVDSLRFNLSLTDLKAPVSGTVVGLNVYTVGGVIKGGDVLMEIVPISEQLIIDAKVPTHLIDKVRKGLDADIRFTAFSLVTTPVIPGKVILVGADRLLKSAQDDPMTPAEYYLAQVETTQKGYKLLGNNVIQAGMPVDVIVKTGERTFLSYILKPIMDRFAVSFKED
ncbi:MAG: HlyD family type I secretion periplasmic adaptor subunit [Magnetococcus sp. DMHC-6]